MASNPITFVTKMVSDCLRGDSLLEALLIKFSQTYPDEAVPRRRAS
jgi:hypothetical protein